MTSFLEGDAPSSPCVSDKPIKRSAVATERNPPQKKGATEAAPFVLKINSVRYFISEHQEQATERE
jgi:hypothetical protein